MIQKESYVFNTFAATRIGEIQGSTDPLDWFWIEGSENIADIMTRGTNVDVLAPGSTWQNGPIFMSQPINEWPIRNSCITTELPERAKVILTVSHENVEPLIDISRYSNYIKLITVTARLMSLKTKHPKYSLKNLFEKVSPKTVEIAEIYWFKEVQSTIMNNLESGIKGNGPYRRLGLEKRNDGIFVVRKRIAEWNEMSYDRQGVPILPKDHPLSILHVAFVHNRDHRGVSATVSKVRTQYWIVSAERIAKKLRYNCVSCRRRDAKPASQVMSPLPIERLKPAPVWTYTAVDLFGPFIIKGEMNKRSSGKCYRIIFTCLLVRAVHLEIAPNHSTDGCLMAFRKFTSIRRFPHKIYSDVGSQLVGASSELKTMYNNLDWKSIKSCGGSSMNLEWVFSPGDAPWYNGCCEALIKSVRKSTYHAIRDHRLTYCEFNTVLYEASSMVNERPVGRKPNCVEDGTYLCPNDLLLGRTSGKLPYQSFDAKSDLRKRHQFVQQLTDAFLAKMVNILFP